MVVLLLLSLLLVVVVVMYIHHTLINAMSAHMVHINYDIM